MFTYKMKCFPYELMHFKSIHLIYAHIDLHMIYDDVRHLKHHYLINFDEKSGQNLIKNLLKSQQIK